jgi:hypothetical protein
LRTPAPTKEKIVVVASGSRVRQGGSAHVVEAERERRIEEGGKGKGWEPGRWWELKDRRASFEVSPEKKSESESYWLI